MKFQGAVIKEQGIKFGIVIVKSHVIRNRSEADKTIQGFGSLFGWIPVVLMAQDSKGIPTYYGRQDIAKFLANTPIQAIPWREYSIN